MRHLISATISAEAALIHAEWAKTRSASRRVSEAILSLHEEDSKCEALYRRLDSATHLVRGLLEVVATMAGPEAADLIENYRAVMTQHSLGVEIDNLEHEFTDRSRRGGFVSWHQAFIPRHRFEEEPEFQYLRRVVE